MAEQFTFELVSPDRQLMSAPAHMVVVPGAEGDFGVLAGHMPVISTMRPGVLEVTLDQGAVPERIFIRGGFADVGPDSLIVLAEEAMPLKNVSREGLEQLQRDAREDLEDAENEAAAAEAQAVIDSLQEVLDAL